MKTILPTHATDQVWDVVVIGAGVAGASVAIQTARLGFSTLLVDAKAFPRDKVCGGCLNQRAQLSLQRLGMLEPVLSRGAIWLNRLDLRILHTAVNWRIPPLLSVRRSTLDETLIKVAIEAGAKFMSESPATIRGDDKNSSSDDGNRLVAIGRRDKSVVLETRIAIVADGLTRSSLRELPESQSHATIDSRIGVQAFLQPDELQPSPTQETLQMLVSNQGYVGVSHADGGMLDVAAALDPQAIHEHSGITPTIERILSCCLRSDVRLPKDLTWLATPHLTRSSSFVASRRLLLIGDSIGYVEPFTGEGMSWALESAEAVIPFIASTIETGWRDATSTSWSAWVHGQHHQRQRQCRWLAQQLRRPRMAACFLRACNIVSPIKAALIRKAIS
jgi:flavin-dependent dehydrogenase